MQSETCGLCTLGMGDEGSMNHSFSFVIGTRFGYCLVASALMSCRGMTRCALTLELNQTALMGVRASLAENDLAQADAL